MENYKVDYFLLSDEWKEEGVADGRIAYCFTGGESLEEHKTYVEKVVADLLFKNDEDYTSWVRTSTRTQEFFGILRFASVVCFRVRDSY